uniref:Uncharacterized protein n=1 Tax=Setaria digitata TaxID=48799 RepID=A0A915PV70_9BILA
MIVIYNCDTIVTLPVSKHVDFTAHVTKTLPFQRPCHVSSIDYDMEMCRFHGSQAEDTSIHRACHGNVSIIAIEIREPVDFTAHKQKTRRFTEHVTETAHKQKTRRFTEHVTETCCIDRMNRGISQRFEFSP